MFPTNNTGSDLLPTRREFPYLPMNSETETKMDEQWLYTITFGLCITIALLFLFLMVTIMVTLYCLLTRLPRRRKGPFQQLQSTSSCSVDGEQIELDSISDLDDSTSRLTAHTNSTDKSVLTLCQHCGKLSNHKLEYYNEKMPLSNSTTRMMKSYTSASLNKSSTSRRSKHSRKTILSNPIKHKKSYSYTSIPMGKDDNHLSA